jgi:hypothetical protein
MRSTQGRVSRKRIDDTVTYLPLEGLMTMYAAHSTVSASVPGLDIACIQEECCEFRVEV